MHGSMYWNHSSPKTGGGKGGGNYFNLSLHINPLGALDPLKILL